MVEATITSHDVKLSLDLTAQGKSPIFKRVQASDYQTLITAAHKLATKHAISPQEIKLKYHDGDNWVVVEDENDVQMAFACAQRNNVKLIFAIRHPNSSLSVQEEVKFQKPKVEKLGIPRKAIKNLINQELAKQAKEVFEQLLQSDDFADVDMTPEEAQVVHEGVFCNGCPDKKAIRGIRYKSTIKKNFDMCAPCEERQGDDDAMLKIRTPGGAPDAMVVIADEEPQNQEEQKGIHRAQDPMKFIKQMMKSFKHGGRPHGIQRSKETPEEKKARKQFRKENRVEDNENRGIRGNPFKNMIHEFLNKYKNGECQNWTDAEW